MKATVEFDIFQRRGADLDRALATAQAEWEAGNPGHKATQCRVVAAYPGDHSGRWVTVEVTHEPRWRVRIAPAA